MNKKPKQEMDLVKLATRFYSEEQCRAYLEELRWPNGIACPRCGAIKVYPIKDRGQYHCESCSYQFSVTAGTIFHDSHLSLWKWFAAVYLMCESKKGISANQMKRTLSVHYKTAWYLCHRIRAAMKEANPTPLTGIVEVDETWIGGKKRGVGSGSKKGKTLVAGAVQREGPIRLQVVQGQDRLTLHRFIGKHVDDKAEAIYTDEWPAYIGVGDKDTRHEAVNHSQEEWVRGDVHTNTVESAWSLFKGSIIGAYHKISVKHLPAYLSEFEFRFNNRENPFLFRDTMLKLLSNPNLQYQHLIAHQ